MDAPDMTRHPAVPSPDKPPEDAWNLYGITRSGGLSAGELNETIDASADGVDQATMSPLEIVDVGSVAAIVRRVPLSEFDADVIGQRGDDVAWLQAMVSGHNEVIALVHERQAILPARFGALYPDVAAVRKALAESEKDLLEQLGRLAGSDEWAVHVYANPETIAAQGAADDTVRRLEEEIASSTPGRGYFLKRRLEEERANAWSQAARAMAQNAFDRLSEVASAGQPGTAGQTAQHDSEEIEILRAAFFIARDAVGRFETELRALEEDLGVRAEATGPWPPYSFVSLPESGQ